MKILRLYDLELLPRELREAKSFSSFRNQIKNLENTYPSTDITKTS